MFKKIFNGFGKKKSSELPGLVVPQTFDIANTDPHSLIRQDDIINPEDTLIPQYITPRTFDVTPKEARSVLRPHDYISPPVPEKITGTVTDASPDSGTAITGELIVPRQVEFDPKEVTRHQRNTPYPKVKRE